VLDAAMSAEPLASVVARAYTLVKVDVGNWDKHVDIAERFGNPIARGIPAMVIANDAGVVLYATKAGELATARQLSRAQFEAFFANLPR
jgi:protein disulfide-isomerase